MIRLQNTSTRPPEGWTEKETDEKTREIGKKLNDLQNLLYAEGKHSLLVILQGMDASGKDGAIRKVFKYMDPQGMRVRSFKVPTEEEKNHDFLWRLHQHAPEKGMIQIFNRSQYEDILVTRVHGWCSDELAEKRMKAINDFEELLMVHNGTHILKFFLHISREEQALQLAERKKDPRKMWKYNKRDLVEAGYWERYMQYYEEAINNCNRPPWIIVPADENWYKEYLVAKHLLQLFESLNMRYPGLDEGE